MALMGVAVEAGRTDVVAPAVVGRYDGLTRSQRGKEHDGKVVRVAGFVADHHAVPG